MTYTYDSNDIKEVRYYSDIIKKGYRPSMCAVTKMVTNSPICDNCPVQYGTLQCPWYIAGYVI